MLSPPSLLPPSSFATLCTRAASVLLVCDLLINFLQILQINNASLLKRITGGQGAVWVLLFISITLVLIETADFKVSHSSRSTNRAMVV
jgi:hypothetical protein